MRHLRADAYKSYNEYEESNVIEHRNISYSNWNVVWVRSQNQHLTKESKRNISFGCDTNKMLMLFAFYSCWTKVIYSQNKNFEMKNQISITFAFCNSQQAIRVKTFHNINSRLTFSVFEFECSILMLYIQYIACINIIAVWILYMHCIWC